jgi:tetratricopeptide (TPR) repeat protein
MHLGKRGEGEKIVGASSVGRNDPCPCGSGKKYKKCCLSRDQGGGPKVVEPHEQPAGEDHDHVRAGALDVPAGLTSAQAREYVERLDRWSNAARDALDEGRVEEAEKLADRLRTEYPDQIDGYELCGMVRLQHGRWAEAAEGFEQAIAIALKHPDDYDKEFIQDLRRDADHARAHAKGRDFEPGSPPCDLHAHRRKP